MTWRALYDSCISETNPDRLKKLVFQLEEAIVLRYHDLANQPNAFDELQAIKRAAQRVLQLKVEKLGWPQPAFSGGPAASIPASFQMPAFRMDSHAAPIPGGRFRTTWQKLVTRIQTALFVTQRAWQSWVFKSMK